MGTLPLKGRVEYAIQEAEGSPQQTLNLLTPWVFYYW